MSSQHDLVLDADRQLAPAEVEKLARLEAHIEAGMQTFKRVGLSLFEIRDQRLYRANHGSFEDYCQERWGMVRRTADRLIAAAQVAVGIETHGSHSAPAPTSERQVRPLAGLAPEVAQHVWARASELAGGEAPTYATVEQAAAELVDKALGDAKRKRLATASPALNSSESVDWYSPEAPVELGRQLLGGFDLDPASSEEANLTVRARRIYTIDDDGLSKPWLGKVWLNWPGGRNDDDESNASLWTTKLLEEFWAGRTTEAVVLLFNVKTGANWFEPFWDHALCFPRGRMKFVRPGGIVGDRPNHYNAAVYLGPQVERFAELFAPLGRIVVPRGSISEVVA